MRPKLLCGWPRQKGALSSEDGDARTRRSETPHHLSDAALDLIHLLARHMLRDGRNVRRTEHFEIGADHSRDPRARFRSASAAAVGCLARVVVSVNPPQPEMDVGGHGKMLGGHATPAAPRRAPSARWRRPACAVRLVYTSSPLRSRAGSVVPRRHAARDDRDDVGRRAADVEKQRVGKRARHQRRARPPVGRGDLEAAAAPPLPIGIVHRRRRPRARRRETPRGTRRARSRRLPFGGEAVGQFGGHGHRHSGDVVRTADPLGDLRQRRGEPSGSRQSGNGCSTTAGSN